MNDKIIDIIDREEELINFEQSAKALDVSTTETGRDGLSSIVQPTRGHLERFVLWVLKYTNTSVAIVGGVVISVILFAQGIRALGSVAVLVAPSAYQTVVEFFIEYLARTSEQARYAADFLATMILCGVVVPILYLIGRRYFLSPTHGPSVSTLVTTPGDGTTQTDYLTEQVIQPDLRDTLKSIAPGAQPSDKTRSLGDRLKIDSSPDKQIPVWQGSAGPNSNQTDHIPLTDLTPYICELTFREAKPHAAFVEGVSTPDLLAREYDDIGLVPNYAQAILADNDVPAVVEITARARPKEADRHKRFAQQFGAPVVGVADGVPWSTDEGELETSNRASPQTVTGSDPDHEDNPLAELYDLSVRVLVLDTSPTGETAESICTRLASRVEDLMPAEIEAVDAPIDKVPDDPSIWHPQARRARRKLTRMHHHQIAVPRLFSIRGTPTRLAFRPRRSIPVTPYSIWNYLGAAGKSHDSADRSAGTKSRDTAAMTRPNEAQMDPLRWSLSWSEFVDDDVDVTDESPAASPTAATTDSVSAAETGPRDATTETATATDATPQARLSHLWRRIQSLWRRVRRGNADG